MREEAMGAAELPSTRTEGSTEGSSSNSLDQAVAQRAHETRVPSGVLAVVEIEDGSHGVAAAGTGPPKSPPEGQGKADEEGGTDLELESQQPASVVLEEPGPLKYYSFTTYLQHLPKKLKGGLDERLLVPSPWQLLVGWFGAFASILVISALHNFTYDNADMAFLIGSFGASAVLLFGVIESKLAQPRNFVGGQVISAVVGIVVRTIVPTPWVATPVGMSFSLLAMQLTATTHPPGGATALIVCSMSDLPKWHGWSYLVAVIVDCALMLAVALLVNNLDPKRRYPTFWY